MTGDQLDVLGLAALVREAADQIPDAPITVARDRQVDLVGYRSRPHVAHSMRRYHDGNAQRRREGRSPIGQRMIAVASPGWTRGHLR
jgi:hypothetical protein